MLIVYERGFNLNFQYDQCALGLCLSYLNKLTRDLSDIDILKDQNLAYVISCKLSLL